MRTRSFLFLGLAVAAASTLMAFRGRDPLTLVVPENGFISLNPPLTATRIGTLSTRTTHPQFLRAFQELLDSLQVNMRIDNPYQLKTKGEMIGECKDKARLQALARHSVSCGKWKRKNKQCGRCVPCLIRRAAFKAAGVSDLTKYRYVNLSQIGEADVLATRIALERNKDFRLLTRRLLGSASFQGLPYSLDDYIDVAGRGFAELNQLFT